MGRAVGPVVAPADNYVATVKRVAVGAEVPALKFKLDVNALPLLRADLALGLAVGKSGLNGFDDVAQFFGDEAKEENDAEFVDRLVAEAAEVEGTAVRWTTFQGRVAHGFRRRRGRGLPVWCAKSGRGKPRPYGFKARGFWFAFRRWLWRVGRAEARPYRFRAGRVFASGRKSGHDMSCPYRFRAGGLWRGKERYDVGPFGFALGEIAKSFGKF